MAWRAGDRRYNIALANPEILGWLCDTPGTPGVWVTIYHRDPTLIFSFPMLFAGAWNTPFPGSPIYGAPATADWGKADEAGARNFFKVPVGNPQVGAVVLDIWVDVNTWDTPTPSGLVFSVIDNAFTPLVTGTIDAGGSLGPFHFAANVVPGSLDDTKAVALQLTSNIAAGEGQLRFTASVSGVRSRNT